MGVSLTLTHTPLRTPLAGLGTRIKERSTKSEPRPNGDVTVRALTNGNDKTGKTTGVFLDELFPDTVPRSDAYAAADRRPKLSFRAIGTRRGRPDKTLGITFNLELGS